MSDDLDLSGYSVPEEGENAPQGLYARLVATCDELVHLKEQEPAVLILFRNFEKSKNGKLVLGSCCQPSVQGELKPMFEWLMVEHSGFFPDFLILLDRAFWDSADDRTREVLLFHELMHTEQATDKYGAPKFDRDTGAPVWSIRGHDLEEFNDVVRRYGAWSGDVERFIEAESLTVSP